MGAILGINTYDSIINTMASKYGIPSNAVEACIKAESNGNPGAGSPAGAQGLMQLMPATFASMGVGSNILDPTQNIEAGTKYLARQYKAFGTWELAFAAYNAGPGAVQSGAWKGYAETTAYVKKCLGYMGSSSSTTTGTTPAGTTPADTTTSTPGITDWLTDPVGSIKSAFYSGLIDIGKSLYKPIVIISIVSWVIIIFFISLDRVYKTGIVEKTVKGVKQRAEIAANLIPAGKVATGVKKGISVAKTVKSGNIKSTLKSKAMNKLKNSVKESSNG